MNTNSCEIINYNNTNINSVVIACYFDVGSICETKSNYGITHLVEHMFFRRLDDMTQKALYKEIMKIGGDMSGTTYYDYVKISIKVAPKHLKNAINIFVKLFHQFHWSDDEIESEKRVVKKQIAYSGRDDYFHNLYFKGTKLNNCISGTVDDVDALTTKQVNAWKDRFFTKSNACVVITGNFQQSDYLYLCDEINKVPQGAVTDTHQPKCMPKDFANRNIKNDFVISMNGSISDVCICFDIDERKIDVGSASILCEILGAGCGSRLSNKLRDELFVTDDVFCSIYTDAGVSRLIIEYSVDNEELILSIDELMTEILSLQDITKSDIDNVIEYFTTNQLMNIDDSEQLADRLYFNAYKYPQKHITPNEKANYFKQITCQQVKMTANELFRSSNMSMFVYNNSKICARKQLLTTIERFRVNLNY